MKKIKILLFIAAIVLSVVFYVAYIWQSTLSPKVFLDGRQVSDIKIEEAKLPQGGHSYGLPITFFASFDGVNHFIMKDTKWGSLYMLEGENGSIYATDGATVVRTGDTADNSSNYVILKTEGLDAFLEQNQIRCEINPFLKTICFKSRFYVEK